MLAGLGDQLRMHAETGELPDDPLTRAFIEMNNAATIAMNESVGGDEHDQACEDFQGAYQRWGEAIRRAGL